jgi:hypothetical protein
MEGLTPLHLCSAHSRLQHFHPPLIQVATSIPPSYRSHLYVCKDVTVRCERSHKAPSRECYGALQYIPKFESHSHLPCCARALSAGCVGQIWIALTCSWLVSWVAHLSSPGQPRFCGTCHGPVPFLSKPELKETGKTVQVQVQVQVRTSTWNPAASEKSRGVLFLSFNLSKPPGYRNRSGWISRCGLRS